MGLTYIPNQPVFFGDESDQCVCGEYEYKQLVKLGDVTQFQFRLSECGDPEQLVTNPTFATNSDWVLGEGWSISGGLACRTGLGSGNLEQQIVSGYHPSIFKVTLVVTSCTGTFNVWVAGANDGDLIGQISAPGTYTFYGFVDDFDEMIQIIPVSDDLEICIDSITAYEILTPYWIALLDSEYNLLKTWVPSEIVYERDTMTVSIDWGNIDGLVNGACYHVCIYDICTSGGEPSFLGNWDFLTIDDWVVTVNAGTAVTLGPVSCNYTLQYNSSSNTGAASAESATALTIGTRYYVKYAVTGWDGGHGGACAATVMGGARIRIVSGSYVGPWRSFASAVYEEVFVADAADFVIEFESIFDGGGNHKTAVDYVILTSCDIRSNDFLLTDADCTNLINACCNEDSMGFIFTGSGFSPKIRLESKLVNAQYTQYRTSFESSAGKKSVQYFKRRKRKVLKVETVPEYVHDFLSTLAGYDHVYIGATEYFVEGDEHQVIYNDDLDDMGQVSIELTEKIQLVENTNCGAEESGCVIE